MDLLTKVEELIKSSRVSSLGVIFVSEFPSKHTLIAEMTYEILDADTNNDSELFMLCLPGKVKVHFSMVTTVGKLMIYVL